MFDDVCFGVTLRESAFACRVDKAKLFVVSVAMLDVILQIDFAIEK